MNMKVLLVASLLALVPGSGFTEDRPPETETNRLVRATTDTAVNGFFLIPTDVFPFSPVITVEFNLPESSQVDLFFSDTLFTDTTWIVHSESLGPGLYRLPSETITGTGNAKPYRKFLVHFSASSIVGSSTGFPSACTFTAVRPLSFR